MYNTSTIWQTLGPKTHSKWAVAGGPQLRRGCLLTAAAWVKHMLGEASWNHWPRGFYLSRDLVFLSQLSGEGRPLSRTLPLQLSATLPTASQASSALYTEFGSILPSFQDARSFSTALERGFDWAPCAPFPSHSRWLGSLCSHRALPLYLALWVTVEQTSMGQHRVGRTLQTLGPNTVSLLK